MPRLAIDELSGKTALQRANPRREARLSIGMRVLAVVGCLFGLWASPGCFELNYPSCRIRCGIGEGCPRGLNCVPSATSPDYFCAAPPAAMCDSPGRGNDASAPDKDPNASGPPQKICHRGNCLTLPDTIRSNLVLLLWPSNLPALGSPVSVWPDLSGTGNDAHAVNPAMPPTVTKDGVKLATNEQGVGFVVTNSASLDLGAGDFVVLGVAGAATTTPGTILAKSDASRTNPRRVVLERAFSETSNGIRTQARVNETTITAVEDVAASSANIYSLRRTGTYLDLRANGVVIGKSTLATADQSTSNAEDIFIGVASPFAPTGIDTLQAVFIVRGPVDSTTLGDMEQFLRQMFMAAP